MNMTFNEPAPREQLTPEASASIEDMAAKHGRDPADMLAEAMGLSLVAIDAKMARRMREVEEAADIERGSLMETFLEPLEDWWRGSNGANEMQGWIEGMWQLSNPAESLGNLEKLYNRWQEEDAAESAARSPETEEGRTEAALALTKIIEEDCPFNERAKVLAAQRERLEAKGLVEVTMHLPRELVLKAEREAERTGVSVGEALAAMLEHRDAELPYVA